MSAIRTPAARCSRLASYQFVQRAGLHQTIVARAGKESALGHEGRAEEIDREKAESLKEQKDGKGSWKEGLASDSESIVKAERGEVEASAETIKKLQDEAKKVADK